MIFNMDWSLFYCFIYVSDYNLRSSLRILLHDALYTGQDQERQARTTHIDGAEILDEVITRSRGEIRRIQSPKISSTTPSSLGDIKPYSPRVSQKVYSPHIIQLRGEGNPSLTEKGLELKQTPSPGPSTLGQSSRGSSSS